MADEAQEEQQEQEFELSEQEQQQEPQGEDQVIPRSALPEPLRDLPPEQIGSATQALVATLESRNQEIEQLRQMSMGQGQPQQQEPEEEPLPDVSEDELKDMILEEPEQALDYYIRKNYGPQLKRIEQMAEQGVQSSAFAQASQELPEFGRYRDQVEQILQGGNVPATYDNIEGAYLMARGAESVESARRESSRKVTSEPPSPPEPKEETPQLSEAEEKVRKAFGMSREDYIRGRDERVEVTPPGLE